MRLWRDLLVTAKDPATLLRPESVLHHPAPYLRAVRAFLPQILVAGLAAGVLAAAAYLFAGSGDHAPAALLSVIGALGLTGAAISARVTDATRNLLARLHDKLYSDLVATATNLCPDRVDSETRRAARVWFCATCSGWDDTTSRGASLEAVEVVMSAGPSGLRDQLMVVSRRSPRDVGSENG